MISLKRYSVFLLTIMALSTMLVGCVRDNEIFNTENNEFARKQIVRISDGAQDEIIQRARNVNPTIDTFVLVEVLRSPNDESDLNQPLTVSLTRDTSIIGKYNRKHGTNYVELPTSLYTVLGDLNAVTFAPGETSKTFSIRLDKTNLDLSKQYALAYKVNTG